MTAAQHADRAAFDAHVPYLVLQIMAIRVGIIQYDNVPADGVIGEVAFVPNSPSTERLHSTPFHLERLGGFAIRLR